MWLKPRFSYPFFNPSLKTGVRKKTKTEMDFSTKIFNI